MDNKDQLSDNLFVAAKNKSFKAFIHWVSLGADIYATKQTGLTENNVSNLLVHSVRHNALDIAQYLLDEGLDVNESSKSGVSALSQAALNNNVDAINLLSRYPVRVDKMTAQLMDIGVVKDKALEALCVIENRLLNQAIAEGDRPQILEF